MHSLQICNNAGISQIAISLKCKGPLQFYNNIGINSGIAVGEAYEYIKHGYCDSLFAGGAEEYYKESKYEGGMLLLANQSITQKHKPLAEILHYGNELGANVASSQYNEIMINRIINGLVNREDKPIEHITHIGHRCSISFKLS